MEPTKVEAKKNN